MWTGPYGLTPREHNNPDSIWQYGIKVCDLSRNQLPINFKSLIGVKIIKWNSLIPRARMGVSLSVPFSSLFQDSCWELSSQGSIFKCQLYLGQKCLLRTLPLETELPREGQAACKAKAVLSFLSYFKTLRNCPIQVSNLQSPLLQSSALPNQGASPFTVDLVYCSPVHCFLQGKITPSQCWNKITKDLTVWQSGY